jgi:hypothetical protein
MSLAVTRDPYKRGIASVRKTALPVTTPPLLRLVYGNHFDRCPVGTAEIRER